MAELSKEQRADMQRLVSGLDVTADKIRKLGAAGYERSAIARFLGVRYQHVRNVLVAAQQKSQGFRDSAADQPARQEWAPVGLDGRVVIPASYRKLLGIEAGGHVLLLLEDGEVRLVGRDAALRRAQQLVARYVPTGTHLSDELIRDRQADVTRESAS
jgi:AbrB family looped-hinge helix DNA binding protein